jgi:hypothetical protein
MQRSMETRGSINLTANRFDNVNEMQAGSEGKGRNSAPAVFLRWCVRYGRQVQVEASGCYGCRKS